MVLVSLLSWAALLTAQVYAGGNSPDGHGGGGGGGKKLTGAAWEKTITLEGVLSHARKFQEFANAGNGTREFATVGYNASADYVAHLARSLGYKVTLQTLEFPKSTIFSKGVTIGGDVFPDDEVEAFQYTLSTPADGLTGPLVHILDNEGGAVGPGCDPADYAGVNATSKIAFVRRGTCTFAIKSQNAKAAGAIALIVYNNIAGAGPFQSRLDYDQIENQVPSVMIGLETAQPYVDRINAGEEIVATVKIDAIIYQSYSNNVIAQTRWGDPNNVVFLGAHLDSVPAGPGINDNGSGSATVAELVKTLAKFSGAKNALRFAWWTAEEIGLVGSEFYVTSLSQEEKDKIALYFNLDMTASPNYALGIQDGDNSAGGNEIPVPAGSAALEKLFIDDFDSKSIPHVDSFIESSSDYFPFADAGIVAGGIDTGAGGLKTPEEAAIFGGTAGVPYDSCYHQACDTIDNLAHDALLINAKAVAKVLGDLSVSTKPIDDEKNGASATVANTAAKNVAVPSTGRASRGKTAGLPIV